MRYDVLVAGAGPAGSTAARECARRGLTVLLLERAVFPRDKPCGGGVNVRAARSLPFDLGPVTERVAYRIQFSLRQQPGFVLSAAEPLTYLTQRAILDSFLAQKAVEAGAVLREGLAAHEVEHHTRHVVLRAGNERFEARTLVVADGANSRTARLAGFAREREILYALEANVTPPGGVPARWQDCLGIDVGDAPGGYGWIFPKGDHLNLGVVGWPAIGPTLRDRLGRLTRFYGYDPATLWGQRGHPLPVRRPGEPVARGSIALVGDAAGLIDPLSGEGIYAAIWSGRLAATCLAAYLEGQVPDLGQYQREVDQTLIPEHGVARQLRHIFQAFPNASLSFVRGVPSGWSSLCRIVRGEQTYAGLKRSLGPLALGIDLAAAALQTIGAGDEQAPRAD